MTKIENAILAEAEARVKTILAEGEREVNALKQAGEAERDAFLAEEAAAAEAIYREQVRRRVANAKLDAKKILLQAKAETLDEIYRSASEEIAGLPKERYLTVMMGLLAAAEDGDTAMVNAEDAKKITDAWWGNAVKKLGVKVTLSQEPAKIAGGVILAGGQTDKNLSLESEMSAFREETEMELAKRLFGEKK